MINPTKGSFSIQRVKVLAWFNVDRDTSYSEALEKAKAYLSKRKDKDTLKLYFHGFEEDARTQKPKVEIRYNSVDSLVNTD
jgi:hypothetical protein